MQILKVKFRNVTLFFFYIAVVLHDYQQAGAVEMHTDLKVGMYWGEMGVDFWNAATWKKEIEKHEVSGQEAASLTIRVFFFIPVFICNHLHLIVSCLLFSSFEFHLWSSTIKTNFKRHTIVKKKKICLQWLLICMLVVLVVDVVCPFFNHSRE